MMWARFVPEIKLIGWGFPLNGIEERDDEGGDFLYIPARRSLNALPTTDTELKLMAAAAMIGLSRMPKNG